MKSKCHWAELNVHIIIVYRHDGCLTNGMWFNMVCTLIDNNRCHHGGHNFVDSRGTAEWVHNNLWPLWWRISLSIRVQASLNNISIFFLPQYQLIKEMFFRGGLAEKGIAWHIDACSIVWVLIDNGKSANQIARLVAIVVKSLIDHYRAIFNWVSKVIS